MKTRVLGLSLLIILATAMYGQSRYDVPFAFQAGGQSFAAGEYRIAADSQMRGLWITPKAGASIMVHVQNDIQANAIGQSGRLVFSCYGSDCFLAQVWRGGDAVGMQLPRPRSERALARTTPPTQTAVLSR